MSESYPPFELTLPHNGPVARGDLLAEKGTNGSQQFRLLAASRVRKAHVPSFPGSMPSSHNLRERLIADGKIVASTRYPGCLESLEAIDCNSPSAAAEVVLGRAANGTTEWKTAEGHPLADYLPATAAGPNRAWLVRGSHVAGFDLVRRLWLRENFASLPAVTRHDVGEGLAPRRSRTAWSFGRGSAR